MTGKKNSFLLRLMTTISTGVLLSTGLAFGQNSVSVGSAEGEPGSDVIVQMLVSSDEDIAGAQFSLIFDHYFASLHYFFLLTLRLLRHCPL